MTFCDSRLDLVRVVPVPVAGQPPQVLDGKRQPAVALDLFQVLGLVAQQAVVVLVAGQHVDRAPEAGPACEPAGSHVGGNQAGGGAYGNYETIGVFKYPCHSTSIDATACPAEKTPEAVDVT